MYDEWRNVTPKPAYEQEYKWLAQEIDRYNADDGNLNQWHINIISGEEVEPDGIDCPICKNKGQIMTMMFSEEGKPYKALGRCKCAKKRDAIGRIRRSGLGDSIERCTFDTFEVNEPWQERLKEKVIEYTEKGAKEGKWLYIGGQPGSGKSHLCTAAVGKLLENYETLYAVWPRMAQELKALAMDDEAYDRAIHRYLVADLLYIDDFFKPVNRDSKSTATGADVRVAFDIINDRYIKHNKITIISSEWFIRELDEIDEATSSRIYERCDGNVLNIKRDDKRNFRYKDIINI